MTCRELYLQARRVLGGAGVDSPSFDAAALTEHFLGLDRPALAVRGGETPAPAAETAFLEALTQRAARRPLQYILGEWPFLSLHLRVGEGVLVPREDTAVLVEALAEALARRPAPRGLDLCAGSGAVGLGLCSLIPGTQVACVELDPAAMGYLRENVARYPQYQASAVRANVLEPPCGFDGGLDFLASNPPYVPSPEVPDLQPEVLQEPRLAVDGGGDGLVFYRAITDHWLGLVRPGGVAAVEIGETQGPAVAELFESAGLEEVRVLADLAGLDRVVIGRVGSGKAQAQRETARLS